MRRTHASRRRLAHAEGRADVGRRSGRGTRSLGTWSRTTSAPSRDRAVAARADARLTGTVLPWHSDAGPTGDAKTWTDFARVVPLQAAEWRRFRQEHPGVVLCVAGDLNVNLGGRHYYGTKKGRETLRADLKDADLACVTETDRVPFGLLRHPNIDHICLDERLAADARVVTAWEGKDAEGLRLSDHSGLVVEVDA